MRTAIFILSVIASAASPGTFSAERYPERPIRLVVPAGAGGNTDIFARILAEKLRAPLGQQVIVDNRPGADGIIGTDIVAKARPDGYTLVMVFPSHPVNPFLHDKLPYDTLKDLAPISMITSVTQVLVVNLKLPARSVKELIALSREKPGALNAGAVARGSLGDLCTELFESQAKVKLVHVTYKAAPLVMAAVMSGEIQVYFSAPVVAIPQIKAERVRALGVSTRTRLATLPDVPTIAESGLPAFEVTGWNGVLAPAGTPRPIIDRLGTEIAKVVRSPEMRAEAAAQGVEAIGNSPAEFDRIIRDDIQKWAKVLKGAGTNMK